MMNCSAGIRVGGQVGDAVKFNCGCVQWLPCESMMFAGNSQCSYFVDVVFNFAVDHTMSNVSRKCTN